MSIGYNSTIATPSALVLCIDCANPRSYNGSGSSVFDVSGTNNTLTIGGTPAFSATQGWTFTNGSTSNYMIRNPITMPTTNLTLEVWCKTTIGGTAIVSYASTAADNDWLLFDPSNLSLYVALTAVATGVSITDGNWKQVIRTSNRSTGEEILYINGSIVYSTTLAAGTLVTSGGSLVLAQEQDSIGGTFDPGQAFGGNIALVRLYNTVLTAAQVAQNFNATRGRFGV
jgi:hypothetical protein